MTVIPLGPLQVDWVTAGRIRLDGGSMFGVVPRVLWERVTPPDPRNRIPLAMNCLVVRDGKRTVLVETGMGERWGPREREIYDLRTEAGGLPGALERLGVRPETVDSVILTHLHFDHAGGAVAAGPGGDPAPAFPNATYVVQKTEWDLAGRLNERTRGSYRPEDYEPIQRAGQLRLVEGEVELFPGVRVVPLPGHTPGMQGVLLRGGGRTLLYPSDLVPTVAHLPYPYIMGYDLFPLTTLETRKRVMPRALAEGWILVLVHEPGKPAGLLREEGSRLRWQPLEEDREEA